MKTLSGIRDVDLKILQELEDHEISKVCSVNKYVAKLCEDESFWLNRLLKKYDIETIFEMKENLTYKNLYRYLFFDRKTGLNVAIQTDNLDLFKQIYNSSDENDDLQYQYDQIGKDGSLNILAYLLLNEIQEDRQYIIDIVLGSANEKVFKWLHKMGLTSYYYYFLLLTGYYNPEYVLPQIKKYFKYIRENDDVIPILETLGLYLTKYNLEEKKIIYDLISTKFDTKKYIEAIMNGLEHNKDIRFNQETKEKFLKYITTK